MKETSSAKKVFTNPADFKPYLWETVGNLKMLGLKKKEKIAILSPNSVEYLLLLLALWQAELIAVPLNVKYPVQKIKDLLQHINCRYVILLRDQDEVTLFDSLNIFQQESIVPQKMSRVSQIFQLKYEDALLNKDQDATIIFTSGSTGHPRAVLHTLKNHYYSAKGANHNIRFDRGDCWLLSLPLYHVGGLAILFRALLGGGSIVVPGTAESLSECLHQYEITHISLVVTQLFRLLQDERNIPLLRTMKAILLGGSEIPPSLIEKALAYRLPIYTTYGSTEMASQITTTAPGDDRERLLTSGRLLPYRELKFAPDEEILLRGETLSRGYVEGNNIISHQDEDGWFHSGDIGKLNRKGYLLVSGRKDNMFISGGENIQPEEIEKQLCRIKEICRAVVVPVVDQEFGKRPVAFLEWEKNASITPKQIKKILEKKIARFKIPDYFFPFPEDMPDDSIKMNRSYVKNIAKKMINNEKK